MEVGQQVRWISQGRGSSTIKIGKIVRVVKKGEMPWKIALDEFPSHKKMFGGWELPGGKGVKEVYFIEVIVKEGVKPRLYMPIPSKLMRY
jgi:hypothetical protein